MKKKLFVLLVLVMALAMVAVAAHASPPEDASGTWIYAPTDVTIKIAGCNTFMFMNDEGTLTGTFFGTEKEYGVVTGHCNGKWSYKGNLLFSGEVNGRSGTLEMRIVGMSEDFSSWQGTWVILSGAEGLENLHGQGTWEGPPGDLTYEGNIHFDPD